MYALLIIRHSKPPELLTIFRSREEFVAAVGLRNTEETWQAATKTFRAVYELRDERDFANALEVIRDAYPDEYEACRALSKKFQIPNTLA